MRFDLRVTRNAVVYLTVITLSVRLEQAWRCSVARTTFTVKSTGSGCSTAQSEAPAIGANDERS